MKKIMSVLIALLLLTILIITGGFYFYKNNLGATSNDLSEKRDVIFVVEKGDLYTTIAKNLSENELIKDEDVFKTYIKLNDLAPKLKAGKYLLNNHMGVEEITKIIIKGVSIQSQFTIPEGYTLRQIAGVMGKEDLMTEEEFWDIVENEDFPEYPFLKGLNRDRHRLEGYLFPDTYFISDGMSPKSIIKVMLDRHEEIKAKLPENKSGLSDKDVLILASLVEAESVVDQDRAKIASVFLNRMDIGMKLQCDSTVQYALDKRTKRVLYKDLEVDSPYNTYLNAGLPPTPICAVGQKSLEAAYDPAKTDYLFFLAKKDGSGQHEFTVTYKEFLSAKKRLGY